jgi:hypothetical protein
VEPKAKLVDTPLEAIRTAKDFLWFAWFLHDAAAVRATITPAHFADEMLVDETGTRVRWPVEYRTKEALERRTWHTILAAMSISAIAADRALDDVFGKPRPLDQESPLQSAAALNDRDATRAIMYMLRNAYAHDPLNPRWLCKGVRVGVFRIKAIGFTLDTTSLDGQPWNIAHVNGQLEYFKLLDYCQKLVSESGSAG